MKRMMLASAIATLMASPALAVGKVYSPHVEKGEFEVEYFGSRSVDGDSAKDNAQKHKFAVAYGVTDWWATELYAIYEKAPGDDNEFEAVEWENIFQLTQPGEYWADLGLLAAYEHTPEDGAADAIELGLLAQKDVGAFSHLVNVMFETAVGEGREGSVETELKWSSRYRWMPWLEPGFEYQGEFGELNDTGDFDDHEHVLGPVVYGKIPLGMNGAHPQAVKYQLGYLFGISDEAADGTVVGKLEYEMRF